MFVRSCVTRQGEETRKGRSAFVGFPALFVMHSIRFAPLHASVNVSEMIPPISRDASKIETFKYVHWFLLQLQISKFRGFFFSIIKFFFLSVFNFPDLSRFVTAVDLHDLSFNVIRIGKAS